MAILDKFRGDSALRAFKKMKENELERIVSQIDVELEMLNSEISEKEARQESLIKQGIGAGDREKDRLSEECRVLDIEIEHLQSNHVSLMSMIGVAKTMLVYKRAGEVVPNSLQKQFNKALKVKSISELQPVIKELTAARTVAMKQFQRGFGQVEAASRLAPQRSETTNRFKEIMTELEASEPDDLDQKISQAVGRTTQSAQRERERI